MSAPTLTEQLHGAVNDLFAGGAEPREVVIALAANLGVAVVAAAGGDNARAAALIDTAFEATVAALDGAMSRDLLEPAEARS